MSPGGPPFAPCWLTGPRLAYVAAWAVAYGIYVLVFLVGGAGWPLALAGAVGNAVPDALFGVVALRNGRRWADTRPGAPFVLAQVAIAVLVIGLAAAGKVGLGHVLWSAVTASGTEPADSRPPSQDAVADGAGAGEEAGGEMSAEIMAWQAFMSLLLYGTIASTGWALSVLARLRLEEARASEAEALAVRAELAALRAQLNPHFLFNTLHTLLALVRSNPAAAEEALEQFGDLLRYVLRVQQGTVDEVQLAEEWEFVQNYLALERLRVGERLLLDVRVEDDALGCVLPAFTLQTLVENAIRHAIAPRSGPGRLWIAASRVGERLRLEVRDDGPGASDEQVTQGTGSGLRLVRGRLAALYGSRATIDVQTRGRPGFAVVIELPCLPPDPEHPSDEPP